MDLDAATKIQTSMHFIDLNRQRLRLKDELDTNITHVLQAGQFIMGPEVFALERRLAAYCNVGHSISCANGTDALLLPMMAWGIGPGDAVFCPSFTYCASAEAIALLGATPVFVDIERDTYNMSAVSLEQAIIDTEATGDLVPKAVMTVDLFGQSADYPTITPIVRKYGLKLIADSAQGFGTTLNKKHPSHWSDVTTTSFYPAKPLGCYGDGGAVLTNDDELAHTLISLRNHGQGKDKYDNVRVGLNSRLDTLQAAILLAKLTIFDDEISRRNEIATTYIEALSNRSLRMPFVAGNTVSTWAQFTIEVDNPDRFAADLKVHDIPTARYYPKPIHLQTAYSSFPRASGGLAHTEAAMSRVISLPMHAYLDESEQNKVIDACLRSAQ